MKIESPAFKHSQPIPPKHTCKGQDVSPQLIFGDVPAKTVSFALIVDDPDAPMGTFDHWIAWNIPGDTRQLSEGVKLAHQGRNGFGVVEYRGPCPPPGKVHRYFFKLYALDTTLSLDDGATKAQLEAAIEGHVLAKAELVGTFIKP
jgi:Raf kinase inhibitor-like YbhB/YbcL family protein